MNDSHNSKKSTVIDAAHFPALRTFLRGYFHQDMKDEYGSPEEAVREFCKDADEAEWAAVAKEWATFMDLTKKQPIEQINALLTGQLGSAYSLAAEDLKRITALLRADHKSK